VLVGYDNDGHGIDNPNWQLQMLHDGYDWLAGNIYYCSFALRYSSRQRFKGLPSL
jgi:hypothetical protein